MTNVANLADCQALAAVLAGLAAGQSGEESPPVPYTGPNGNIKASENQNVTMFFSNSELEWIFS